LLQTTNQVPAAPAAFDKEAAGAFSAQAESRLAGIRSELLIFLQDTRTIGDLDPAIRNANLLSNNARVADIEPIAVRAALAERILLAVHEGRSGAPDRDARRALDLVAEMEALVLDIPLQSDPLFSVSDFLDESFDRLNGRDDCRAKVSEAEAEFEIDEETMEIFREEANELLETIAGNLRSLTHAPNDHEALWNIRRCAHTFKGAAGVIGLQDASQLAHRVEDLLDRLAENKSEATPTIIELLTAATRHLNSMTLECGSQENSLDLGEIYAGFDGVMAADTASAMRGSNTRAPETRSVAPVDSLEPVKPPPAPIVRVALDKLDELLDLAQNGLTYELQAKLRRIRMVRFGMLATRFHRAVHVTCQEEDKKAEVVIENEDFEIDTQILDSLVEPLLHLLRNAVVHGIETPETRRLIGKPEKGQIRIRVASVDAEVIVSVSDDGRGISAGKLREQAVASGAIDQNYADSLTEKEALDLMFLRGLTTADKLSLNAGRGVGMSIVRESIGSCGGSISVETQPQNGTTFTIRIPVASHAEPPVPDSDAA